MHIICKLQRSIKCAGKKWQINERRQFLERGANLLKALNYVCKEALIRFKGSAVAVDAAQPLFLGGLEQFYILLLNIMQPHQQKKKTGLGCDKKPLNSWPTLLFNHTK